MSGEEEPRGIGLKIVHQFFEPAKSHFILRDGLAEEEVMLEGRLAFNSQYHSQVFERQVNGRFRLEQSELGRARATQITGQRHVSGGRAIREKRRREESAQDIEAFDLRNE